jgi:acyl-coenzyme A thioesterase PaaI-like protein
MAALASDERRRRVARVLQDDPLATDVELARRFGVSVQTVRLDRLALGIPELRERTMRVAELALGRIRSLGVKEIVGEIVELSLGESGISRLEARDDMSFARSGVIRGQFIFAQAESLALALIDADVVLTGLARVKFRRPVQVGEVLLAKGRVVRSRGHGKFAVEVLTLVAGEEVFRGKFLVAAVGGSEA